MGEHEAVTPRPTITIDRSAWLLDLLLIVVLLVAAWFRLTGVNWDQNQHLHPDERFLTMVTSSLDTVDSVEDYFDTAQSSLNPHNRGYGFFVYGTLPIFLVRYVGEALGRTGYDEIHLVGRQVSALMDLGTVLLVYLIGTRLFRKRWPALLAAAFAAFSVLPIQSAHYYTVESFTNFFSFLAFYFAALLLPIGRLAELAAPAPKTVVDQTTDGEPEVVPSPEDAPQPPSRAELIFLNFFGQWGSTIPYVLFGAALGMAVASKLNAAALAVLLPAAVLIRWLALPPEERERWLLVYARNLIIGAVVSLIFFRICQPYAFNGPGFFGFMPNAAWVKNISDQRAQASGDVDFPPALQWARRPVWFGMQHMILWGLGLPLGLLAWGGFLWMGWRLLRTLFHPTTEMWRRFALVWGWTALYTAWQLTSWNPTMRYFLLVYPALAIIAAWVVSELWERAQAYEGKVQWRRILAAGLGLSVLALTFAWAFAFTRIYTRPITRVQASEWIYQNIPAPLNLRIDSGGAITNQPLGYRMGYTLYTEEDPLVFAFTPRRAGQMMDVQFDHIASTDTSGMARSVVVAVSETPDGANPLAITRISGDFPAAGDPRGEAFTAAFETPVQLDGQKTYYLILDATTSGFNINLGGIASVGLRTPDGVIRLPLPEPVNALRAGDVYEMNFVPVESGVLREVMAGSMVDWEARPESKRVRLSIYSPETGDVLAQGEGESAFAAIDDVRGEPFTFTFSQPLTVSKERLYGLRLEFVDGPGTLAVYGSRQTNETSWDDALPLSLHGYNPYDYQFGIFRSDLNFEMYWNDSPEKLRRFLTNLDQADVLFISSNRQWGTTVRVPERYPLTTAFYRRLIGCPLEREITWCYSVAEPGRFTGDLGYELAAVFQSDPNLGSLRFNTQFAEEAFTVYDHPKVLIFRKTADYDPEQVREILEAVDLTQVVHLTPGRAADYPGNLMLPEDRLSRQTAGGTWSELFNTDVLQNRYPGLAAVLWYAAILLIGLINLPFTRLALRGLPDRGYPFIRLVGMLALALLVWLAGSLGVQVTPLTVSAALLVLLIFNLVLAYFQRGALRADLGERWRSYLLVEALFLGFFLLFLLVRLGNPDLWHPWKGGEKPMDFSYFNAVLKSNTFPPYDPWFAGGYINYYYYGFVIVGMPVKWLGIVPSIAYNLILPTLFSLLAVGAYSIGWNLTMATGRNRTVPAFEGERDTTANAPVLAGMASALGVAVLGNWGTVRMIWHGLQQLADMQVPFEAAGFFTRIAWTAQGIYRLFTVPGMRLPYGPSDWYWIPSRAIPGEPITEFPAFTFLYADLHAHMIALPITVLVLAWALSMLLGKWGWRGWGHLLASFALGGLAVGALRPANTWDWPTYMAIACVAIVYVALRYGQICCFKLPFAADLRTKRILIAVFGVVLLAGLSSLFYQPFVQWYGQGYNKIDLWNGARTPFWSYMTHWGGFLFLIVTWMMMETMEWMQSTPYSSLKKLRPYVFWIQAALGLLIVVLGLLYYWKKVEIVWLALPLGAWAGVLLLRPRMPDAKRAVLFLIGTAMVLTLFVEVAILVGDLGRMNTVFKFYLQAWTLLALCAGASLVWLLPAMAHFFSNGWRTMWESAATIIFAGMLLFPLLGGLDKINDRMSENAPLTLDGMVYMETATYQESLERLDLSEDYRAIRWMQENVVGTPVIVEAHLSEYRWGSRFTIYTGLPGVVGWNWHQRQQRAVTPPEWVTSRVTDVGIFYQTIDRDLVVEFLQRYAVRYIVVGQLEHATYSMAGLEKFAEWEGELWREVYRDGRTVIYEVPESEEGALSQK